jgi:hypothetical protein
LPINFEAAGIHKINGIQGKRECQENARLAHPAVTNNTYSANRRWILDFMALADAYDSATAGL